MNINGKVPMTKADRTFLKLVVAAMLIAIAVIGAYGTLVVAFERHPLAPFIEPDRVLALQLFSSACGVIGPSFTLMPLGFELEEKTIKVACETKLQRAANS